MEQRTKISLLLFAVFLCFSPINLNADGEYGRTRWGMNQEEIKSLYPIKTFKELDENTISFEDEIAKEKVEILFSFLETRSIVIKSNEKEKKEKISLIRDKLYKVRIIPKNKGLNLFYKFDGLLEKKYGPPTGEKELEYKLIWNKEKTEISLQLFSDNETTCITYLQQGYKKKPSEEKPANENLDKL